MAVVPFLVVAWIIAAGLYGLVTSRDLIRRRRRARRCETRVHSGSAAGWPARRARFMRRLRDTPLRRGAARPPRPGRSASSPAFR